jgi:23S rRNA pseudouridine1911/1915/1917 synthase
MCTFGRYLKIKGNKPGDAYLGLVHRLDRPTSGVILFAKTSKGAARLCEDFRERRIVKKYVAAVEGTLTGIGRLTNEVMKQIDGNRTIVLGSSKLSTNTEIPSRAVTAELNYKSLHTYTSKNQVCSLLSIDLGTGRKHQIRAQLSSCGFPIIGDVKYGASRSKDILLHAYLISFHHPISNEQVRL